MRIQLDLPPYKVKELEYLMNETDILTKKDFINHALTLLKWAIEERKQGRAIGSIDKTTGQYREVVLPALDVKSPYWRVEQAIKEALEIQEQLSKLKEPFANVVDLIREDRER